MHVLQLCYKPPYPPVDGGTLAMNSVTQGLMASGHKVKVLSVCSDKHPVRSDTLETQYKDATGFEAVYIDLSIHPLDAAVSLLCGESYNVKRFVSKEFDERLTAILQSESFDVVHIESIFLAPYVATVRKHSDAKVVLRAHNVEHRIWRQIATATRNPLKRWYLKKLALALRAYELEHINDFDGIACITANDAETFRGEGCRKPLADIPFGVDIEPIDNVDAEPQTLFHIGSMDWRPNEEGIRWFIEEVLPKTVEKVPNFVYHLAGRNMPEWLTTLNNPSVDVIGEVPDAKEFVANHDVAIVPLLAGSGIRIKIIESMAMGKTVITTRVGAEGILYDEEVNLIIAENKAKMVEAIRSLNENPQTAVKIGQAARKLVEETYDNRKIIARLLMFYEQIKPGSKITFL